MSKDLLLEECNNAISSKVDLTRGAATNYGLRRLCVGGQGDNMDGLGLLDDVKSSKR